MTTFDFNGNELVALRSNHPLGCYETKQPFELFLTELAEWSDQTFGPPTCGPMGALNHLAAEVQEARDDPTDIYEYVDILFLAFDAARKAGFDFQKLQKACWEKLEINRKRKWTNFSANGVIEHDRTV